MRDLYNKNALDNISSQTKLDKMVNIVPPGLWVSIIGAVIILAGLIVWGFKGSIPTSVSANGLYANEEGLFGHYANSSGFLLELDVKPEDYVKKGDTLAVIAEDENFHLQQIDERIAYVENMTFESDFDTVTIDTEELAEIKRKANTANSDTQSIQASLDVKKEQLAELGADVDAGRENMIRYKETYYATLALDNPDVELQYNESEQDYESSRSSYENAKNSYLSIEENYYQQKKQFDAKYRHFVYEEATEEEQRAYDAELANLQSLADTAEDYSVLLENAEEEYDDANINLDNVREEYMQKLNEASGLSVENSIAYNEYSELLSSYNTLLSEYRALNNEISELEIKLIVSQFNELRDYDAYNKQFDNQKSAVLSRLETERENCLNDIKKDTIKANIDGLVYRVDAELGSSINKGDKVITMYMTEGVQSNHVIAYVPFDNVTSLDLNQEVHITPTGLNSNEYGYMYGKVVDIKDYLESQESMMTTFNSAEMVNHFTSNGAVVRVEVELIKDPETTSGYKWSNPKGESKKLFNGDLMDCVFITNQKRPIDLFVPYVKDKLEFKGIKKSESE